MITDPSLMNQATNMGVDPVIHWRTPDGMYRSDTSLDKTLSVDVEAECNVDPTGQGGINRVEFSVVVNSDPPVVYTQTGRSIRWPNYSTAPSRQPWGPTNAPAPFWGFGIVLDLSTLDGGTIEVTATAYSESEESASTSVLTIYNDTDGVDRRPSSKEIYVSSVSGSPTGAGTIGDPVSTIHKAIGLAVANPAGSAEADRDAGGAVIYVIDDTPSFGGAYGAPSWHTSGAWRLTIKAIGSEKTIQRTTLGTFTEPDDSILGAGFGGAGNANLQFEDFEFVGPGPSLYAGTTVATLTDMNCSAHSSYWVPGSTKPHVNYVIGNGRPLEFATGSGNRYSWGLDHYAFSIGMADMTSIYDFKLSFILGVALQAQTNETLSPCYTVGTIDNLKYSPGDVDGFVFLTTGTHANVLDLGSGVMAIQAIDGTLADFAAHASGIVSSTYWGVIVTGATSGANNGCFPVLGVGHDGSGYPYLLLYNTSVVTELGGASMALMTGRLSDSARYVDIVHTDLLQISGDLDGGMFAHIRAQDCWDCRSWVGIGNTLNRCVFKNLTDGGDDTNQFDWATGDATNCLFMNLSIFGSVINFNPTGDYSGSCFVDSVWAAANLPETGTFIRNNHFTSGTPQGIAATGGSWYLGDPSVDPWDFSPAQENVGTASDLVTAPDDWGYPG